MRTILAALLALFMPGHGKRRSTPAGPPFPATPPRTAPRPRLEVVPHWADDEPEESFERMYVRGYVLAAERSRIARLQRERRRAAVLASLGQDYVPLGVAL
ncbi:hypothetical protein [Streptomyces chilikensis]|uniref:hypothetical protein n=1 Tax=Streptomyces chilikensis TaxID=1194079 RepID=UPI00140AF011|nr:hypothetical protein [Streptomyces chilikensis]